jgi:hypothetical protein
MGWISVILLSHSPPRSRFVLHEFLRELHHDLLVKVGEIAGAVRREREP